MNNDYTEIISFLIEVVMYENDVNVNKIGIVFDGKEVYMNFNEI